MPVQQGVMSAYQLMGHTHTGVGQGGQLNYLNALTNKPFVDVREFGATGNGVTDDTVAIQGAIDAVSAAGGGIVYFPEGTYITTAVILMPFIGIVHLIGESVSSVQISKVTNTIGTSPDRLARAGVITDVYNIDSIISLDHDDNLSNQRGLIKNIDLIGTDAANPITYGIYAPRVARSKFKSINIWDCETGYFTYSTWLTNFDYVDVGDSGVGRVVRSFRWANDGSGSGTGTSCNFQNSYANMWTTTGFDIWGLTYSNFVDCAADNGGSDVAAEHIAYRFVSSHGITLNGCGTENLIGTVIYAENSELTVISHRASEINGKTAGTHHYLKHISSNVTYMGCEFDPFVIPRASFNLAVAEGGVEGGSHVIFINTIEPTGGDAFVSYLGGSTIKRITDDGMSVTEKRGSVVYEGMLINGKARHYGAASPTEGIWVRGDIIWNTTPNIAGTPGWVCIRSQNSPANGGEPALEVDIAVDDDQNATDLDIIGFQLDDDSWHWTSINGAPVGNVITILAGIPAGRTLPDNNPVYWFCFGDMAVLT